MKAWPQQIEQWRQFVIWEAQDIPPDIVLAIIKNESAGQAGRPAGRTCRKAGRGDLPLASGGSKYVDRAFGLMQCIPAVYLGWNRNHPDQTVYFEDASGTNERAARLQIRVGCWQFASGVHLLHRYDPHTFTARSPGGAGPEQLKLALVAYAVGFGAQSPPDGKGLRPKLDKLKQMGQPLTLEALTNAFPTWGQSPAGNWVNRPLQYAQNIWTKAEAHKQPTTPGTTAPSNPTGQPDKKGLLAWLTEDKEDTPIWQRYALPAILIGGVFLAQRSSIFGEQEAAPPQEVEEDQEEAHKPLIWRNVDTIEIDPETGNVLDIELRR